jgi:hypothetical protein
MGQTTATATMTRSPVTTTRETTTVTTRSTPALEPAGGAPSGAPAAGAPAADFHECRETPRDQRRRLAMEAARAARQAVFEVSSVGDVDSLLFARIFKEASGVLRSMRQGHEDALTGEAASPQVKLQATDGDARIRYTLGASGETFELEQAGRITELKDPRLSLVGRLPAAESYALRNCLMQLGLELVRLNVEREFA